MAAAQGSSINAFIPDTPVLGGLPQRGQHGQNIAQLKQMNDRNSLRNQVNSTGSQFFLMNHGESGQAPGQQI